MKIQLVETGVEHPDFIELVRQLDEYYYMRFREIVLNYQQHHDLSTMKCGVVAYVDGQPAACGALKMYNEKTVEMKRIFVLGEFRRQGLASQIMKTLEKLAVEQGSAYAVLETGAEMKDAIRFYQRIGYTVIPNFGSFVGDDICICFGKSLSAQ